jgi:EAL domain-containing protein (putative c-di-GMP-specific phosphodiesterase class I)
LGFAHKLQCEQYQGIMFSRPLPAAPFEELYATNQANYR